MAEWQDEANVKLNAHADRNTDQLLEILAMGFLKEQRRARYWGIFFKLLTLAWLFLAIGLIYQSSKIDIPIAHAARPHTALIAINGAIEDNSESSADNIIAGLQAAFKHKYTKAVMLRINSPGGSPVQAGMIYDEVMRLRQLYPQIPLYAVITDIGASGSYYVASAADAIYADKASLVGSIGVISSDFGFVEAMAKLGITRRVQTAGEHKAFLDPFAPTQVEAVAHWQALLDTVHQQFIDSVRRGRGDRLADNTALFSGMVWTGVEAKALGLVDELGDTRYVARAIVSEETVVDFTLQLSPLERLVYNVGARVTQIVKGVMASNSVQLR